MTRMDFVNCGIKHIYPEDIIDTGATLESVQCETISKLDRLFGMLKVRCHLIKNGITTGQHVAPEHPAGLAVDFWVESGPSHYEILERVLDCGFRGRGLYWNGKILSYHADLREHHASWCWKKKAPGQPWTEKGPLIVDPR